MKILNVVDSLSTLFPKKVRIQLIHAVSGLKLSFHTFNSAEIPQFFNKPTLLNIDNKIWRVTEMQILKEESYFSCKKIVLYVVEPGSHDVGNKHLVPTKMSAPPLTQSPAIQSDITLNISKDEWLQIGLFPTSALPLIQAMTDSILSILESSNNQNMLLGYAACYEREYTTICNPQLDFAQFTHFVGASSIGTISFDDAGFVRDGFSFSAGNHTYYGQVENNQITTLALYQFEYIDEELFDIVNRYDLLLVNWCGAAILA
ncbi:hypothetical protein [Chitinophaga sp. CF418]|uniref:hypothetical protein n=1 Tax=Chitinophaga sp. CF418 TaxID=1855287 RepID=UPI00091C8A61|nr:hypothetical protein [Chitinophaga sp. CF418]SHM36917.1 hypothetical protein SAMN05216311_10223 [Chitinophaga sp. CF418]